MANWLTDSIPEWPQPRSNDPDSALADLAKARYSAELTETAALRKAAGPLAHADADVALEKADWDAEYALDKLFHESIYEVAKGSIDRAKARGELVEKAAASIGGLYAALLGASFSVTEDRLPIRGIIPTIFLALAIVFSMIYLAYITRAARSSLPIAGGNFPGNQQNRLVFFVDWVAKSAENRKEFLRSAVLCLAAGVVFLPVAFLHLPHDSTTNATVEPVPWPTPAAGISIVELAEIRYQAEIDEAATLRAKEPAESIHEDQRIWWFVGAMLIVVTLPLSYWCAEKGYRRFKAWLERDPQPAPC